jgi:hypothetical protein
MERQAIRTVVQGEEGQGIHRRLVVVRSGFWRS